jgi:hypothetical protein
MRTICGTGACRAAAAHDRGMSGVQRLLIQQRTHAIGVGPHPRLRAVAHSQGCRGRRSSAASRVLFGRSRRSIFGVLHGVRFQVTRFRRGGRDLRSHQKNRRPGAVRHAQWVHAPTSATGGGFEGPVAPLSLRRNTSCNAGTTTSSIRGPRSMPPTTTVANGRCT